MRKAVHYATHCCLNREIRVNSRWLFEYLFDFSLWLLVWRSSGKHVFWFLIISSDLFQPINSLLLASISVLPNLLFGSVLFESVKRLLNSTADRDYPPRKLYTLGELSYSAERERSTVWQSSYSIKRVIFLCLLDISRLWEGTEQNLT